MTQQNMNNVLLAVSVICAAIWTFLAVPVWAQQRASLPSRPYPGAFPEKVEAVIDIEGPHPVGDAVNFQAGGGWCPGSGAWGWNGYGLSDKGGIPVGDSGIQFCQEGSRHMEPFGKDFVQRDAGHGGQGRRFQPVGGCATYL